MDNNTFIGKEISFHQFKQALDSIVNKKIQTHIEFIVPVITSKVYDNLTYCHYMNLISLQEKGNIDKSPVAFRISSINTITEGVNEDLNSWIITFHNSSQIMIWV